MLLTLAKLLSKTLKSIIIYLDARISKLVDQQADSIKKNEKAVDLIIQGALATKAKHANKCADTVVKLEIQRSELKALA